MRSWRNLPYRSQRYAELDSQHILERGWLQRVPRARVGRPLHQGEPAGATYAGNNVQAGQTYYYVSTAVDSSNNESVYSNEAQAVIPSP